MQTRDPKQLFLDMQEHPENYTDEQLGNMIDQLDQTPDVQQAWQEFEQNQQTHPQPLPVREGRSYLLSLRKIAAILISAIFLSGLAWAISIHIAKEKPLTQVNTPLPHREGPVVGLGGPLVRFDDTRLDSIFTVVSAHYGKAVRFRSEEAKSLKFIMTWNPDATLADFIDRMNMFDGLRLTLWQDTIFVETPESKVSK